MRVEERKVGGCNIQFREEYEEKGKSCVNRYGFMDYDLLGHGN